MNDVMGVNPDGTPMTDRDIINMLRKNRDELVQQLKSLQAERDKYKEDNERYVEIFERMVKGDVWMAFDDDPVEAYKELARHAIEYPAQSVLKEE